MKKLLLWTAAVSMLAGLTVAAGAQSATGHDWPVYGNNVEGNAASNTPTGITAANLKTLVRRQVKLDGTVDASPIFLHGVTVKGARHDVFFVTTSYGKTIAVDAHSGAILWEFTPPNFASWDGSRQITNSTPVADPDRRAIYAAAPDGKIYKLAVSDGHVLWSTAISLGPASEKIDSPLKVFKGHVVAVTAGYIGDRPPYQGHVAILDAANGKLLHVWNSLCSNRPTLLEPTSCSDNQSAIWGRAGAVIQPSTGNIFVATGNGPYNGKTAWGDAVIELNPEARMIGNYTPADNAELNRRDLDIGSTSPVLLGDGVLAQGGKDGLIRLVSIKSMAGTAPHTDHELQTVPTPASTRLLTALTYWHSGDQNWLFSADGGGAFRGRSGPGGTSSWIYEKGKLVPQWKNDTAGTSPLVAGGLLYIYDPNGGLHVYEPKTGKEVGVLECGSGHWNSPIVVDGMIALPEGNANDHADSGVLDIWSLPGH